MSTINLYNCDNMEFMKNVPDKFYDLAIVDPPYGIDIAKWDTKEHIPTSQFFTELFRVSKNQIIWGGNYFNLPHSENWFCWDKTYRFNLKLQIAEFELAWTSLLVKSKFIRYTYCGNFYGWDNPSADYNKPKNIHPTQKPIDVYKWLLKNYAKEGDKILDTHGGSMSIALACHDLGFDLDLCELDKEYFEAGVKRFEIHKLQLNLFNTR